MIGMAVIIADMRLSLGGGFLFGAGLGKRVDGETMKLLAGVEGVLHREDAIDDARSVRVAADEQAATFVRIRGNALALDRLKHLRRENERRQRAAHGQTSASPVPDQKSSERYLEAESEKMVTTTPSLSVLAILSPATM